MLFDFARQGSTNKHVQRSLPHYSTIMRKVRPWLFFNAWLRSETVYFPVNAERSAARVASSAILRRSKVEQNKASQSAPVLIVPPSEYARADITAPHIFDLAWRDNTQLDASDSDDILSLHGNVCKSKLGKFREYSLKGQNYTMRAEAVKDGFPVSAFGGSIVELHVTSGQHASSLDPTLSSLFQHESLSSSHESFKAITSSSWINSGATFHSRLSVSPHSYGSAFILQKESFREYARPGDHLTVLSPSPECNPTQNCGIQFFIGLVVSSPGPPGPSQKLLFLVNSEGHYKVVGGTRAINNVKLLKPGTSSSPFHPTHLRGVLSCGTTYYVYPFLLYCDDFNEASGKKGSAGGCYMLPMGLPLDCRRNSSAVRVIGVTGPGVSTNHILRHISRDIIQGCTSGFRDVDPDGNECLIFLDFIGFVSDYPACSHVLDVMGHNADCPCHLCFFVRGGKYGKNSQFGYDTRLHSSSDTHFRTSERTAAVQSSESSANILKYLGLRTVQNITDTPLHLIERLLHEARSKGLVPTGTPLGNDGLRIPVMPAILDPYRSTFVGIDHLLHGLAKDALDNAFSSLPNDGVRRLADRFMVDALLVLGLANQNKIYNFNAGETHTMRISDRFAVLLVAEHCFRSSLKFQSQTTRSSEGSGSRSLQASEEQRHLSLELVRLLSSISAATYFLPRNNIDGSEAVQRATGNSAHNSLRRLQQLSKKYATLVDDLLKTVPTRQRSTAVSKKRKMQTEGIVTNDNDHIEMENKTAGFRARKILDNKPNLHRLIEAFEHTVPLLGHARQVAELSFEATHQQMKRGLEHSGGADRQLDAMLAALGNYWKGSLHLALKSFSNSTPASLERQRSKRFLLRVLFGREHCKSMENLPASTLHDLCQEPLLEHLNRSSLPFFSSPYSYYSWTGVPSSLPQQDFSCGQNSDAVMLRGKPCKGARLSSAHPACAASPSAASRDFSKPQEIASGCVVQACYSASPSSRILQKTCSPSFWAVTTVFDLTIDGNIASPGNDCIHESHQENLSPPHAIVLPVIKQKSSPTSFAPNTDSGSWFLPLTSGVRKVGLLHNCSPSLCSVEQGTSNGGITHGGPSFMDGGSFSIFAREDGYPPRTA